MQPPTKVVIENKWWEVFYFLSEHPIIKNLLARHGGDVRIIEVDYYLRAVGNMPWSDVFEKTATRGMIGVKARIVMLLLWITADGSTNKSQLKCVVSCTLQAGIRAYRGSEEAMDGRASLKNYRIMIDGIVEEISHPIPDTVRESLDKAARIKNVKECDHYDIDFSSSPMVEVLDIHSELLGMILFADEPNAEAGDRKRRVFAPHNSDTERVLCWLIDSIRLGSRKQQNAASDEGERSYFSAIMPGKQHWHSIQIRHLNVISLQIHQLLVSYTQTDQASTSRKLKSCVYNITS